MSLPTFAVYNVSWGLCMIACRYVGGGCSTVGDREFDAVGQRAVFSERSFCEVVLGNAPFITEEDFNKVGFTADELSLHGPSGARVDPPQSFNDKLGMAQQMFRDMRARVESEVSAVLAEALDAGAGELEPAASS